MAHVFVGKRYPFRGLICIGSGFLEVLAFGGDAKDAAAICDNSAFLEGCAGMEAVIALLGTKPLQSLNGEILFIRDGIAVRGQHYADRRVIFKLQIYL